MTDPKDLIEAWKGDSDLLIEDLDITQLSTLLKQILLTPYKPLSSVTHLLAEQVIRSRNERTLA